MQHTGHTKRHRAQPGTLKNTLPPNPIPLPYHEIKNIYGSGHDCSISSAFALEILQSCTEPSLVLRKRQQRWLIEVWTKWTPFCKQHFEFHFLLPTLVHSTEVCSMGPTNDKPALVLIMVWHETVTNHYLDQGWPHSLTYICITRPPWVNELVKNTISTNGSTPQSSSTIRFRINSSISLTFHKSVLNNRLNMQYFGLSSLKITIRAADDLVSCIKPSATTIITGNKHWKRTYSKAKLTTACISCS